MRKITCLTDLDILGTPGMSAAAPRLTARAVVVNPAGELAVMYAAKFGIHTLPGGGVEEGESIETALRREIAEETGCTIAAIEPLGIVEENRAHADYTQINHYFIVRTADATLHPHLTALEAENDTRALWCTPEDAWERIAAPTFERPQGKFLQARDVKALEDFFARQRITAQRVTPDTPLWEALTDYAAHCPWVAGPHVADMVRENRFTGWEAIFAAVLDGQIIGYCTFLRTDYYPENRYWPWISSIFVDENHRSQGVCGQLIDAAIVHARAQSFRRVYIPSDMVGFYERYGFVRIDELVNYGGDVDPIFARDI